MKVVYICAMVCLIPDYKLEVAKLADPVCWALGQNGYMSEHALS